MGDRNSQARQSRSLSSMVIEPFSQLKFGVYVIVICLLFLVGAGLLFHNSFLEQYKHVLAIFEVTDPEMQWEVISNNIYIENLRNLALLFLVFIAVMMAVVFRMTHKYYGPLVSIKRFASSIESGKYFSRVSVRKGDELIEIAESLNAMAQELEKKHGSMVNAEGEAIRRRASDSDNQDS